MTHKCTGEKICIQFLPLKAAIQFANRENIELIAIKYMYIETSHFQPPHPNFTAASLNLTLIANTTVEFDIVTLQAGQISVVVNKVGGIRAVSG